MSRQDICVLYDEKYYNRVIDITKKIIFKDYRFNYNKTIENFFYIASLFSLGRFDEAEEHCLKCIKVYKEKNINSNNFYDMLSYIYFHKGEYHRYFNSDLFQNISNRKYFSKGLYYTIQSIIKEYKGIEIHGYEEEKILQHIKCRHDKEYFMDSEKILSIVRENFSKAEVYYSGYHVFKIFKCDSVALGPNHVIYDYLKVIAGEDDPSTIITVYPIRYSGDLNFVDITNQYNQNVKLTNNDEEKRYASRKRERFNKRQAGKKK